jgi:predicted Zn-dependent protease
MNALNPMRRSLAPLSALLLLATGLGCATNPVTGKKELSLVSESQEIAAGRQSKEAVAAEFGTYEHRGWTSRVDSLGKAMARRSHRPDLEWNFTVLDDATVNAFAAPGGYIYITRGILAHLGSEAQLAGVVGHEIGHVTAKHYSRAVSRQQIAGLGLMVGSVVSESIARYGQVAQAGLSVLFLKYGRDEENESDRVGVDYSVASGYDAREMPATYRTLARLSERAGARIPSYLSTHPDPAAREETVRQLAAAKVGARTDLIVRRDEYVRMLDGMVYGTDPRQGYFEGSRYYHPEMAFTMDFPSGWQTQNSRAAVMAANEAQKAVMQVTLVNAGSLTPAQFAQKLVTDRQVAGAEGRAETIHGYSAWVGRVTVQDEAGNQGTLSLVLLRQNAARMFQFLAQVPNTTVENAFLTSVRSFQALNDAARMNPTPARIRIVAAPQAGTFSQVVGAMGAQGVNLEESATLNGMGTGDAVARGRLLKIVSPPRLRS